MKKNIIIMLFILSVSVYGAGEIIVGIAKGYPPYQFVNQRNGKADGLDADLMRLIMSNMKKDILFYQDSWSDVLGEFKFGSNIDCVTGMEITKLRRRFADFTDVIYKRSSAVFVLEKSNIEDYRELVGKVITGDKDSYFEEILKENELKDMIRIKETASKEEAIDWLKTEKSVAAIMPEIVGFYLAKKAGIKVRIIHHGRKISPVAIAVKKGNYRLLNDINKSIRELEKEGEIDLLIEKWTK